MPRPSSSIKGTIGMIRLYRNRSLNRPTATVDRMNSVWLLQCRPGGSDLFKCPISVRTTLSIIAVIWHVTVENDSKFWKRGSPGPQSCQGRASRTNSDEEQEHRLSESFICCSNTSPIDSAVKPWTRLCMRVWLDMMKISIPSLVLGIVPLHGQLIEAAEPEKASLAA